METLRLLRQVIGGIYYMSLVSFAGLLKVRGSSEVFPSGPFHGGLVSKPNIHFHRQTYVCRMYTIKPTGTPSSHTKSYNLLANAKKKSRVTGTRDVPGLVLTDSCGEIYASALPLACGGRYEWRQSVRDDDADNVQAVINKAKNPY